MPDPGEIWDRSRTHSGAGLHYTHLELPFTVYDDFLMAGDPSVRTGYYYKSNVDYGLLRLYEIAHREYPANPEIRTVLESFSRVALDSETFGWTLPLTHGEDDLAIAPHPYPANGKSVWTFDQDGVFEGFAIRKAAAAVSGGALNLTVEYTHVEVRMRNGTADTEAEVFFVTDDDTSYNASKSVPATVTAGDDDYRTYLIDMSANPNWTGRIRQIRVDPVAGDSTGTVSIDSVRITSGAQG